MKFDFDKVRDGFSILRNFGLIKSCLFIKNFKNFIENNNDKIGFIFCGNDRGNLNYIKYQVKSLKLENNIKILGYINDEKLISIYKYQWNSYANLSASSLPLEAIFFNKIFYSKNILDENLKKFVTEFDLKNQMIWQFN